MRESFFEKISDNLYKCTIEEKWEFNIKYCYSNNSSTIRRLEDFKNEVNKKSFITNNLHKYKKVECVIHNPNWFCGNGIRKNHLIKSTITIHDFNYSTSITCKRDLITEKTCNNLGKSIESQAIEFIFSIDSEDDLRHFESNKKYYHSSFTILSEGKLDDKVCFGINVVYFECKHCRREINELGSIKSWIKKMSLIISRRREKSFKKY